ncbi:MAG: FMN-binding glutamate synthase family protein [Gammaproteobacteria bacterium]|nr:FMN-binding glutamate synthase family protein [Gammaproteobacteria bacterium]MCP4475664.1 FMN-binding glutamate synthase family protein [Gammaproteobacteria bacterium]
MLPQPDHHILFEALAWVEVIFFVLFFFLLIIITMIAIMALIDAIQHKNAIRHNYPFIGRFRNWFMHLGVFFRAYFFTEDREEMPFSRAHREWVNHAAKNKDMTKAFGSTRATREPGTIIFANDPFPPIDRDHVDAGEIVFGSEIKNPYATEKFFHISAMSFGALSVPAVQALSHGAKMAGIFLDTGEGGLAPYHLEGDCDLVAEIGTAKYGYRTADGKLDDNRLREVAALPQVKMFSIKLSQGAKPGKGGMLPGTKITAEIAKIRGIPVGEDSISPNRWPEINNVYELLDMISHIRNLTEKPVGCKLVVGSSHWMETMCLEIWRRGIESAPDFIIIDSADGGTGAAPMSLMDYMGLHIHESLPLIVNMLIRYDLKKRIRIGCSGKLINPGNVAWALCMGADYINSARGFMFSLGCIQAMRCNKDTCPTGVTTHNKRLQSGLDPSLKKVRVMNYAINMHRQVGMIAHSCGVHDPRLLRRYHVHIVQANDKSVPAEELWPYPRIGEALEQIET